MAVEVIDKLKPKNGGSFPIVEAVDVEVSEGVRLPEALNLKAKQTDLEELSDDLAGKASTSDLNTATASLQAQIDQLISPVTQDAEVQNARVDANGTSYATLKTRLDLSEKEFREDLDKFNCTNLLSSYGTFLDSTINGISIVWTSKFTCSISGTATGYANFNIITSQTVLPSWLEKGKTYNVYYNSTDEAVVLQCLFYVGESYTQVNVDNEFTVPDDCTGIIIRIRANNNSKTYSATVNIYLKSTYTNKELSEMISTVDTKADECSGEIEDIQSDISVLSENAVLDFLKSYSIMQTETINDVTFTWSDDLVCTVSGTASAHANQNLIYEQTFPFGIEANTEYIYNIDKSGDVVYVQLYYYTAGGNLTLLKEAHISTNDTVTFPSDAKGLLLRLRVENGKTADETVKIRFCSAYDNNYLSQEIDRRIYSKSASPYVSSGTVALSDIREDGYYVLSDSWTVTDAPSDLTVTGLTVENFSPRHNGGFVKQTVESILSPSTSKRYYRISNSSGATFSDWIDCSGGGGGGSVNNYYFTHTDNSYEVTATPTITTDTNNYLASTGDNTDVTTSIVTMLSTTGICRLGAGVFYVKDLVMPDNTSIIGSGTATEIHLLGTETTAGFAIKLGSNCIVKDLMILGAEENITIGGDMANRHGIVWEGDATEHGSSNPNIPTRATVENVYIKSFKGGGITFNDTGYGVTNCVNVINSYIWNCKCGINISYWSEFHRFTGLHVSQCYYGAINNGGNNMFANCSFSQNNLGMLMDNSSNQSPNNSHGSVVGCVFNHSGTNNNGTGIKMLNCGNGFIFSGCQLFFSKIELVESHGVVFSNFNFGSDIDISISGGAAITFSDCMFGNAPTFAITDNNTVRVHDCYIRSTGVEVTN